MSDLMPRIGLHLIAHGSAAAQDRERQRELWERVRFVYAEGFHCRACPMKHTERQGHGEVLRSCDLLDDRDNGRPGDPEDCPGLDLKEST